MNGPRKVSDAADEFKKKWGLARLSSVVEMNDKAFGNLYIGVAVSLWLATPSALFDYSHHRNTNPNGYTVRVNTDRH